MCHFAMGLTHCYKTTVFFYIYQCVYPIKTLSFIGKIPMTMSGVSFSTLLTIHQMRI